MGLDIPSDLQLEINAADKEVRHSRRIAQIKIKEDAERRKIEEIVIVDGKSESSKRKGKKYDEKHKDKVYILFRVFCFINDIYYLRISK